MGIAALVIWLLAAVGGFFMLATWIAKGGSRQPRTSHIPPALIFGHFVLAVIGLIVWIVYLAVDKVALAWIAFALLVVVAVLGAAMFLRWIPTYRAAPTVGADGGAASTPAEQEPAEKHFPVAVVAGHGVFAVVTVVLVLLTALGVGG